MLFAVRRRLSQSRCGMGGKRAIGFLQVILGHTLPFRDACERRKGYGSGNGIGKLFRVCCTGLSGYSPIDQGQRI